MTNKKKLVFKELDAAQLPRVLADVDAAVINSTFAIPAGLIPLKDAIYIENKDSPYANLIVTHKNNSKKEQLAFFIQAFQSLKSLLKQKRRLVWLPYPLGKNVNFLLRKN